VSETQEPQAEPLLLEEAARAAQELAARGEASRVAAGFLELIRAWAAPSAVLTAVRDPAAPAGFRLVPALCAGSLTLGIEKTLARLAEDSPESLARPTVLRGEEVPGVRVRDNVVVPWWCEEDSGLLVLRGVPRPSRPGLGEALALAGAVVWPRLLGSPAARIEAVLRDLRGEASRLESAVSRQVERLQTATPAAPGAPDAALVARLGDLETELAGLQRERDALARELDTARQERETAGLDLAAARQHGDNARRELDTAREDRRTAERELDKARRELAAVTRGAGGQDGAPGVGGEPAAGGSVPEVESAAWKRASAALNVAVATVRRAAFVPPLLRVSMEDVAALASQGPRPARRLGIALLDRDVVALEPVAAELEGSGIEVRLANQPEELALLLKSPDASAVDAIVCDVMSFRPDQNVAGLLRGWDKDRPGLVSYLSYDTQSPVELERARRTPMSLTAGHIPRPLTGARLAETLDNLAKRLGRSPSGAP
jgi:hypothetical protein